MDVELSGIVVCTNEAHLLPRCLRALSFCDDLVVVDLESSDGSRDIAQEYGARVIQHPRVPIVELVRAFAVSQARCDWLVVIDPDMVFPPALGPRVRNLLHGQADLGAVFVPYQNTFLGRPLRHGRWGGTDRYYPAICHRDRFSFSGGVHEGMAIKPGFRTMRLQPTADQLIRHDWAQSLEQLLEKHRRYECHEGHKQRRRNARFRWLPTAHRAAAAFWDCFVTQRGFLDGRLGLFLSVFWGTYSLNSDLALRASRQSSAAEEALRGVPDTWLRVFYEDILRLPTDGRQWMDEDALP